MVGAQNNRTIATPAGDFRARFPSFIFHCIITRFRDAPLKEFPRRPVYRILYTTDNTLIYPERFRFPAATRRRYSLARFTLRYTFARFWWRRDAARPFTVSAYRRLLRPIYSSPLVLFSNEGPPCAATQMHEPQRRPAASSFIMGLWRARVIGLGLRLGLG